MAKRDMGTRTMTNSEMQDRQRHVSLMREGRVLSRHPAGFAAARLRQA